MRYFIHTPNVVVQQMGLIQDITDCVSTELRMLTFDTESSDQVHVEPMIKMMDRGEPTVYSMYETTDDEDVHVILYWSFPCLTQSVYPC